MEITRVTVEILGTPVESAYVAAGNAVSTNYHILSRIDTKSGVQGPGIGVELDEAACERYKVE